MDHKNHTAKPLPFKDFLFIFLGSFLYACSTLLFIFPHSLLLGGTSGISVILESFLHFSPGTILTVINSLLIVLAFLLLGKEMGIKTLVGSVLTTAFIGILEPVFDFEKTILSNPYLSAAVGAVIIAVASGIMFYVDSSSGGTDVIALIIKKYWNFKIGKALLVTDVMIVVIGGILSGAAVFFSSFLGLLLKTFGIDIVISFIKKQNRQSHPDGNDGR